MGTQTLNVKITRVLALAVAFILALVSLPSMAADTTKANIDTTATGSIIVHKYSEPSVKGEPGTGAEVTPHDTAKKLSGVKFKVEKIREIDLTSDAGWKKLEEVTKLVNASGSQKKTVADALTTLSLTLEAAGGAGNNVEKATEDGVVTFSQLPLGAYVVTEGDDTGNNNILAKAEPFIVTVPFPVKTGNGWLYDVHVYPKNPAAQVKKIVDDADATKHGDTMRWYVSFVIPGQMEVTSFKFEDKIDTQTNYVGLKARILPQGTEKTAYASAFKQGQGTELTLPAVTKSGLNEQDGSPAVPGTPGEISVLIDSTTANDALTKIKAAKNSLLVFELSVKVRQIDPNGSGEIKNQGGSDSNPEPWAKGYFNGSNTPSTPGGDGTPTPSKWGKIDILTVTKPDPNQPNEVPVKDVEFKIYKDKDMAERAKNGTPNPGDTPDAIVTTKDNGKGDFTLRTGDYYLVQTGTPAGFNTLENPIKFELIGNHKVTPYTDYNGSDKGATVDGDWKILIDKRTSGDTITSALPNLPLTGASGQLLLALAGGAVLLTAVGTFMMAARRKKQD